MINVVLGSVDFRSFSFPEKVPVRTKTSSGLGKTVKNPDPDWNVP